MTFKDEQLWALLADFKIVGELVELSEIKAGHIHDTFLGTWEDQGVRTTFVHQRLNTEIFPRVDHIVSNLEKILSAVNESSANSVYRPYSMVPTNTGEYLLSKEGQSWRTYEYVTNSISYNTCPDSQCAFKAGKIAGFFQKILSELDPSEFNSILASFHDPIKRMQSLEEAASLDSNSRAMEVSEELSKILSYKETVTDFWAKIESAPARITHNDLKFNNILFDKDSPEAIAVIDLDICMPGSPVIDFGDMVRDACFMAREDDPNPENVKFEDQLFEGFAKGYVGELAKVLEAEEVAMLSVAPQIVAASLASRFLTDYLTGDKYFKTDRPGQNLDRTRNQIAVIESLQRNESKMSTIIKTVI